MGHSRVLLDRIAVVDRELEEIDGRLLTTQPDSVQVQLKEIREFVVGQLSNIRKLLNSDVTRARNELLKHVSEIRLVPQASGPEQHYVAEGNWNLMGGGQ